MKVNPYCHIHKKNATKQGVNVYKNLLVFLCNVLYYRRVNRISKHDMRKC